MAGYLQFKQIDHKQSYNKLAQQINDLAIKNTATRDKGKNISSHTLRNSPQKKKNFREAYKA